MCWLKLKPTNSVPNGWLDKREKICNRLEQLDKTSVHEATIEEIDDNVIKELDKNKPEVVKNRKRVNLASKIRNSYEAITFNILRREGNEELQDWKSYPGIDQIVNLARNVIEKNTRNEIVRLIEMMKVHENQQTASIIATIAIIIGSKLKHEVSKVIRLSVGDIISWDVPIIKHKNDWPQRKRYTKRIIYGSDEEEEKMKRIVHGYLGRKASREMEQFHTKAELQ